MSMPGPGAGGSTYGDAWGFPALGFNPAPGEPVAAEQRASQWRGLAERLAQAENTMVHLSQPGSAWQGQGAQAFSVTVGELPRLLRTAHHSLDEAAAALKRWAAELPRMQHQAQVYEREAQAAQQRLQAAQDDSALGLSGERAMGHGNPLSAQEQQARQRVDAAQSELGQIRASAQELQELHRQTAQRVERAIQTAMEQAPTQSFLEWIGGMVDGATDAVSHGLQGWIASGLFATASLTNGMGLGSGQPGQPGGPKYTIGPPTRPPIKFHDDFVYDPNASPGFDDYVSWNKWGLKADAARVVRPDLDDALNLYDHFRDGTGTPMTIDYEEAYREDPSIRQVVDNEIASARQAAERIHEKTGRTEFSISGDATSSSPHYPETENWQKTLGGHTVWGSGDVRIEGNQATMTVTVHAEDRYNFNRGAADIATGTPDSVNGRFTELGWSKPFNVNGSLTRTITWELGSSAPPEVIEPGDVERNPAGEDRADGRESSR